MHLRCGCGLCSAWLQLICSRTGLPRYAAPHCRCALAFCYSYHVHMPALLRPAVHRSVKAKVPLARSIVLGSALGASMGIPIGLMQEKVSNCWVQGAFKAPRQHQGAQCSPSIRPTLSMSPLQCLPIDHVVRLLPHWHRSTRCCRRTSGCSGSGACSTQRR